MADTIPQMYIEIAQRQPNVPVQLSKDAHGDFQPVTYGELLREVSIFALGLDDFGARRGDNIGIISDNRKEWLIADLAILGIGAVDVPRGCDATAQEIAYILSWSGCSTTILENERQLKKILDVKKGCLASNSMPLIETPYADLRSIILIDPPSSQIAQEAQEAGLNIHLFSEIMEKGLSLYRNDPGFY
ncbi:MAG: AMP-binding protein, partial [Rectinema sp.]